MTKRLRASASIRPRVAAALPRVAGADPRAAEQISGVILYDETLRQSSPAGIPFPICS